MKAVEYHYQTFSIIECTEGGIRFEMKDTENSLRFMLSLLAIAAIWILGPLIKVKMNGSVSF
uniref:hypothetical protein n=1 Tax=Roseivirga sp. TaxID=1964215 RepID=UPI0040488CBD